MREFFFSFRFEVREDEAYLANLLSPLPSSFSQATLLELHFLPFLSRWFFSAYSSPIAGFFTHCCYEWMVGEGGEEKRGKEKGRGREDAQGWEGKNRDERKGDEETCRSDKQCFFPLPQFFSSFTQSPSPRSTLHFTLSRPVPSRPVPSFPTIPFFPRAFTPSLSLLISYHHAHLSHFLSFPFLFYSSTPLHPPTHQPTPLSFILRPSITHTSIKSFPL